MYENLIQLMDDLKMAVNNKNLKHVKQIKKLLIESKLLNSRSAETQEVAVGVFRTKKTKDLWMQKVVENDDRFRQLYRE
jgi:serine/threonine-protein kinase RIO1